MTGVCTYCNRIRRARRSHRQDKHGRQVGFILINDTLQSLHIITGLVHISAKLCSIATQLCVVISSSGEGQAVTKFSGTVLTRALSDLQTASC